MTDSALHHSGGLTVLDLFSGIGGFSLGLEAAGLVTVAFCEVSAVCRHLLAHHWPEVKQYDDVQTLTADRLAADGIAVDVVCGGFPCQDLSYAGAGAGLAGARSGLFWEIVRLVRELIAAGRRPRYLILENVAALLGRGLGEVLGSLASLGYDLWWDCIPAFAVGAPHRRDRVWIVAYPRGEQHQGFGDAFRRAVAAELSRASVANAEECERDELPAARSSQHQGRRPIEAGGCDGVADVSNAAGDGRNEGIAYGGRCRPRGGAQQRPRPGSRRRRVAQSNVGRVADGISRPLDRLHGGWAEEPEVPRVAAGVPARAARLHGLGNAVVPKVPEVLGRALLTAEAEMLRAAA